MGEDRCRLRMRWAFPYRAIAERERASRNREARNREARNREARNREARNREPCGCETRATPNAARRFVVGC